MPQMTSDFPPTVFSAPAEIPHRVRGGDEPRGRDPLAHSERMASQGRGGWPNDCMRVPPLPLTLGRTMTRAA